MITTWSMVLQEIGLLVSIYLLLLLWAGLDAKFFAK
jgi:hypothetical protein